jgi:hypothetical protein
VNNTNYSLPTFLGGAIEDSDCAGQICVPGDCEIEDFDYLMTTPFLHVENSGLVLQEVKSIGLWALAMPFSEWTWLLLLGCCLGMTLLMIALSYIERRENAFTSSSIVGSGYHVVAFFLGGEDYEWLSGPARTLRLSMLLLVLVIQATYTANLAAFLTAPSVITHGPSSLDELRTTRACIAWAPNDDRNPSDVFGPYINAIVMHPEPTEEDAPRPTYSEQTQYCIEAIRSGDADIFVGPTPVLQKLHLQNCDDIVFANGINFGVVSNVGYITEKTNFSQKVLITQISTAITWLKNQPVYAMLLSASFGVGRSCPSREIGAEVIMPENMGGLMIIVGSICLGSLAFACAKRILDQKPSEAAIDHTASEGEMLKLVLEELSELRRNTSLLPVNECNAAQGDQESANRDDASAPNGI